MEFMHNKPLWRSLLYVPVNVRKYVDSAYKRGADAIILDLEDSVTAAEKSSARKLVPEVAEIVSRGGADVAVRINQPLALAVRDLEAVICSRVNAVVLPKLEGPEHISMLSEVVTELERHQKMEVGSTKFIGLLETPGAFFRMLRIGESGFAHSRLAALSAGGEDFALNTGMLPEPDGLYVPKMMALLAARAAGVLPLGYIGSVAGFSDIDGFRDIVKRSRRLGFEGGSCIHPAQVPVLNEEFGVGDDDADVARRIIEANHLAEAEGRGSFQLDGKMIDIPIVRRAEALLARRAKIDLRRQRMEAAS